MTEIPNPEIISQDILKPMVLSTLESVSEFFDLNDNPGTKLAIENAARDLKTHNDWIGAIEILYLQRQYWKRTVLREIEREPYEHVRSEQFYEYLSESSQTQKTIFYLAMWELVNNSCNRDDILKGTKYIPPYPYTVEFEAIGKSKNLREVRRLFVIPKDPHGQLKLVKELGPKVFSDWKIKK